MLSVHKKLKSLFGERVKQLNDEALVARGAAIMARKLCKPNLQVNPQERALNVIQEVLASSIRICEEGNYVNSEKLFNRGEQIPMHSEKIYETKEDN